MPTELAALWTAYGTFVMAGATIVMAGATVVLAVVTFAYPEYCRWREGRALKDVVRGEIDENLELLQRFWDFREEVKTPDTPKGTDRKEQALQFVERLESLPVPTWSCSMWTGRVDLLPSALLEDMPRVQKFYSQLNQVTATYDGILRLGSEARDEGRRPVLSPSSGVLPPDTDAGIHYQDKKTKLWQELDSLVSSIIKTGNPLRTSGR